MKKYRKDELIKVLVDNMLKPVNSSYDYVIKNPEINGKPWYQYYTFKNKQQVEDFKKFFFDTLTKNCRPKFSRKEADREWSWFFLMYGLKEDFNQ